MIDLLVYLTSNVVCDRLNKETIFTTGLQISISLMRLVKDWFANFEFESSYEFVTENKDPLLTNTHRSQSDGNDLVLLTL